MDKMQKIARHDEGVPTFIRPLFLWAQLILKLKIKVVFLNFLMFDVTIKRDTGQRLQILQCFQVFVGAVGFLRDPIYLGSWELVERDKTQLSCGSH